MAYEAALDHGPVHNNGHCVLALQGADACKLVGVEAAQCSVSVSDLPHCQPNSLLEGKLVPPPIGGITQYLGSPPPVTKW
jgi:hypothetical protein